jgi:hypothetical protein
LLVMAVVAIGVWIAPHFVFPRLHSYPSIEGTTPGGSEYCATMMIERSRFRSPRLVNVVISRGYFKGLPTGRSGLPHLPRGPGLEIYPNGVFYERRRVGGYGNERIVVTLKEGDVRSLTLSPSETSALLAMPPGDLQSSDLWQHVILPKLDDMLEAASESTDETSPPEGNKEDKEPFRLRTASFLVDPVGRVFLKCCIRARWC